MDAVQQFTELKDKLSSLEKEQATLEGSLKTNEKQKTELLADLKKRYKIGSSDELDTAVTQIRERLETLIGQADSVLQEVEVPV